MKTRHHFCWILQLFLITLLFSALPVATAFAQLTEEDGIWDGITPPPHDRPLNQYQPCSQCHVRSDQWAEVKFEFKKVKLENADDFKAIRDLQYQMAKQLAERCTGSCGKPINYQMHPVRNQSCTLCHEDFLENHSTNEMIINEYNPDASCGGACHIGDLYKKFLGEKIPYWTMAFAEVGEDGALPKVSALFERSRLGTVDVFPYPPSDAFDKAEGKWKHEFKSRLGGIESAELEQLAIMLGANLDMFVASNWPTPIAGALEGKVEAVSDDKVDDMKQHMDGFHKAFKRLADLIKETKLESKYRPPMAVEDTDYIVKQITKKFKGLELKEEKDDKIVWLLDGAEIKFEFKKDETKLVFSNFPSDPRKGFKDALGILKTIEKKFPDAILQDVKFAHAYSGTETDRERVVKTFNKYTVKKLPSKEFKYEIKGDKDTEYVLDVAAILPIKVDQYDKESIIKLKTEIKVKYEKPDEPEVKSEVAVGKAAPAVNAKRK